MQNNTFSTVFIGQNIIKLISVDSTNTYLKDLTSNSEPLPEGTVIMAEHQYAGRGQRDYHWETDAGKNLTFSVFLKPYFIRLSDVFLLNIMVSAALHCALSKYLPQNLCIKWPNDVYYKDKKLGGVLIENAIIGNHIKHTIIGIGLNVNQLVFNRTLTYTATSLTQILHREIDLTILMGEICEQLEKTYLKIQAGNKSVLTDNYVSKLYRFGEVAKYGHKGEIFEGQIVGITASGLLKIQTQNGKILTFGFKEVSFLH